MLAPGWGQRTAEDPPWFRRWHRAAWRRPFQVTRIVITLLLLSVTVPWLSPTAGGWLALSLVVINILVLLPLLLMLVSPRVSLSLVSLVFQLLWAPVARALDFQTHLGQESVLHGSVRTGNSGWADPNRGGGGSTVGQGVSGRVRQAVFVLTVVLRQDHLDAGTLTVRFLLWLLGVRALLSLLATLASMLVDDSDLLDGAEGLLFLAGGRVRVDDITLYSLPFYAGQLSCGLLCLTHAARVVSSWDLLGLLLFCVCSDQRVQHSLKLQ
ncbi:hypothetical protein BaRGS_00020013, partial [Batillaria attramentaria]